MHRRSRGMTLVELGLALLVLSIVGGALIQALMTGAQSASRAGESQLVALAGSRAIDRMVSAGYAALQANAGTTGEMDLAPGVDPDTGAALPVKVRFTVQQVDPQLLRVGVTLTWRPAGSAASTNELAMHLFRYVGDSSCSQGRSLRVGGV